MFNWFLRWLTQKELNDAQRRLDELRVEMARSHQQRRAARRTGTASEHYILARHHHQLQTREVNLMAHIDAQRQEIRRLSRSSSSSKP